MHLDSLTNEQFSIRFLKSGEFLAVFAPSSKGKGILKFTIYVNWPTSK
jgi:hypothetical protein